MNATAFRRIAAAWLIGIAVATAGCGKKAPALNGEVAGVLTFDGKPLANVRIEFMPESVDGVKFPGSYATTDGAGSYKLMCENQKPGAFLGKHRVVILQGSPRENSHDRVEPTSNEIRVPASYGIASKTPLQIDVTANKHNYPIELTSATP
jgi:hypothetical protein